MPRKRKITLPDGRTVDATEIGYRTLGEHWNEYLLDDGTVVRLKPVVTSVVKTDGVYDDNGDPVYLVNSQNVMSVSTPDEAVGGTP